MPELPEVETTLRGISPHLLGRKVESLQIRRWSLRWPIPRSLPKKVVGQTIKTLRRRGKYLLFEFESGTAIVHLGMSGSLRIVNSEHPVMKHDHVDWCMDSGWRARFNDPRRFGALLWTDETIDHHPLIRDLGPEPLTDDFDGEWLFRRSRKRKQAIKTLIMDSKIVVGVGNIYANEALFLAGIRPGRAAGGLTRAQCQALAGHIKAVLASAIKVGGTTLRNFVGGDGQPGYFQQSLYVYGREAEPCRICAMPLKHRSIGQRTTVYCAHCQR
jgi:formamidopyrimidine-DNA glycosylase